VAEACATPVADADAILAATWKEGTPLIPLKAAIEGRLGEEKAWFHHGATTQDAVDTGRMIQAREALGIIESGMSDMASDMRGLVGEHRDQPHLARTFLQDAVPTTFGSRVAKWLSSALDRVEELRAAREACPVQLGGPSGDLASFGDSAPAVLAAIAERLDLAAPPTPWHADRAPVWAVARVVEAAALTAAKVSYDIALLASSPVAEVTVRSGGSSSMPGKRNPIDAVRAVAAATTCSGFASMLTGTPLAELDRGIGGWHSEWLALPMLFHTGAAAVEAAGSSVSSLQVDAARMPAAAGGAEMADPGLVESIVDRYSRVIG
jgi:3-carboxy-cis,cis-muconate cycloisomerase